MGQRCEHDGHKLVRVGDTLKCPHCLREYPLIERGTRNGESTNHS